MKFPSVSDGFATPFPLKPISDKIKFQAIVTELYKCLTIDDLLKMKIKTQNYLEVKQSLLIVICTICLNAITSITDLKLCSTESCLYKICSRTQCHYFLNNVNYLNNFFNCK